MGSPMIARHITSEDLSTTQPLLSIDTRKLQLLEQRLTGDIQQEAEKMDVNNGQVSEHETDSDDVLRDTSNEQVFTISSQFFFHNIFFKHCQPQPTHLKTPRTLFIHRTIAFCCQLGIPTHLPRKHQ